MGARPPLKAYCDASFLVSLYAPDANSARAAAECRRTRAALLLSPLCELELANALQVRVFRKELTAREVAAALAAFGGDLASGVYSMQPVSAAVYDKAKQLSGRDTAALGTRSLDVLHVAAALVMRADVLFTFDVRQRQLAGAEGLRTAPRLRQSRRGAGPWPQELTADPRR